MTSDADAVHAHIEQVSSPTRRRDAHTLIEIMRRVTGQEPSLWSGSIVGFGQYHYRYASGHEGDAPAAGFAARKAASTIYLPDGVGAYERALSELGPHSTGVGCLYIKDLETVDLGVLEQIIDESYRSVVDGTYMSRARDSHRGQPE